MKILKIITSMSTALILCWSMGAFANPGLGTKLKRKKMRKLAPVSAPKTNKGKRISKSKTKSKAHPLGSMDRCENQLKAILTRSQTSETSRLRDVYSSSQTACNETNICFSGCARLRANCRKAVKAKFDCKMACKSAQKDKRNCKKICNQERKSFLASCKQGPQKCKKQCRSLRASRSCRKTMKSVIDALKKSKLEGRKKAYSTCKKAYKL